MKVQKHLAFFFIFFLSVLIFDEKEIKIIWHTWISFKSQRRQYRLNCPIIKTESKAQGIPRTPGWTVMGSTHNSSVSWWHASCQRLPFDSGCYNCCGWYDKWTDSMPYLSVVFSQFYFTFHSFVERYDLSCLLS